MYASFATVTLLVLGLLVVLARASAAMFDDPGVERDERQGFNSEVPATGAARIERHAETGQSRAERKAGEVLDEGDGERKILAEDESDGGAWTDDEHPETDEKGLGADEDGETPWQAPEETETQWGENSAEADARREREQEEELDGEGDEFEFTTGALLANVALSQGVFGVALVGAAWFAEIPPAALGVVPGDPWNVGLPAVGVGVAVGVALYVGNELAAALVDAAGVDYSEGLREALAPDDLRGWLVLLGVVLPIIAGFEELLFRAALIGAFSAGFGLSPWLMAVFSTVAFAVGHGAQGPGGIAVTGLLGFALAATFVLTGSLLVVVVAHYLVNALEFVVHEGLGIEWT
jgi:membrane protease YdiL (CAAX protease family)